MNFLISFFHRYVLSNRVLLQLVETLPKTIEEIQYAFYPAMVPPIVETRLVELHKIIIDAREQPASIDVSICVAIWCIIL